MMNKGCVVSKEVAMIWGYHDGIEQSTRVVEYSSRRKTVVMLLASWLQEEICLKIPKYAIRIASKVHGEV